MMKRLILLLNVLILLHSQCPANLQLTNITSDSVQILALNSSNISQYSYTFESNFSSIPKIGISVQGFSLQNMDMLEWQIKSNLTTESSTQFVFTSQENIWISIKIGFVATIIPQLTIGQLQMSNFTFENTSSSVTIFLQQQINNFNQSIGRTFINGFSLASNATTIFINILRIEITSNSLSFLVKINEQMDLDQLYISYVIVQPQDAPYGMEGNGFLLTNFNQTSQIYDLHQNLQKQSSLIQGIISFQLNGNAPITFSSTFHPEFILNVSTTRLIPNIILSYFVFGVPPNQVCSSCPNKFIHNNECIRQCPNNTLTVEYRDGGKGCKVCSSEFGFTANRVANKCECQVGYRQKEGSCEKIPFDQLLTPEQIFNLTRKPRINYIERDCSNFQNTYWTGYRCACKVGFTTKNGVCGDILPSQIIEEQRPISFIYTLPIIDNITIRCELPNEQVSGNFCVCVENYYRTENGTCELIQCPNFSTLQSGQCICNEGFTKQNQLCVRICPTNSLDNGQGVCDCIDGFTRNQEGSCVFICDEFQVYVNGICQCLPSYNRINGTCQRCPSGTIFIEERCVSVCGINEVFDEQTQKCRCREGFGKFQKRCVICPDPYFVIDGYCATCVQNADYKKEEGLCVCRTGFSLNDVDDCQTVCTSSYEIYDNTRQTCDCVEGLGLQDGQCKLCEFGIEELTQNCKEGCNFATQIFISNECVCRQGFGLDENQQCANCSASGSLLVDGFCGQCPMTFIVQNNDCACPANKTEVNGNCVDTCKPSQLIDQNGQCYQCPIFEVAINGRCQCKKNYVRKQNGRCELKCPSGKFPKEGICASCALTHVYDEKLQACVCPEGFYQTLSGLCEKSPLNCQTGYYPHETQGCLKCSDRCLKCTGGNVCLVCQSVYILAGGNCVEIQIPTNGNGIIEEGEECDDGNIVDGDGCSSSGKIEEGWACRGQQISVCVKEKNYTLSLEKEPLVNQNNVFVTLRTQPQFNFSSESQMKNFIKTEFTEETTPASTFCMQKTSDLNLFDCLIMYPSGLPASNFSVGFSYQQAESSVNTIRRELEVDVQVPKIIASLFNIRRAT